MISIKKFLKISITFLLILFGLVSFPQNGSAEDSLTIKRWLIDSKIIENGDLEIREDITFNFNDKFNGVFREIVLTGAEGIDKLKVAEMVNGNEIIYSHANKAENGDNHVFMAINDGDNINVKIFSPSKDEDKTFRLNYTIKNVAIKYNDTGELYYKFLGKENSTPISFLQLILVYHRLEMTK